MLIVNKIRQVISILLLMSLAFYFQELSFSNVLQKSLPEWPYIFALYFSVSPRYFFGIFFAFLVGLVQDVFLGIPTIGLNAIIYLLSSYFLISIRIRFKHMTIFLQSITIGVLVLVKVFIVMIYESVIYSPPMHFWVLLSIVMSMLIWPIVYLFFSYFNKYIS